VFSPGVLGGPGTGSDGAHLLGSSGGGALAYVAVTATTAFGRDPVPLRRYGAGGWSSPETFPEPVQHMGMIATSMAPAGDTTFVWASLDAVDVNSVNLHARTLTATGSWSDRATIGDTSVGWWQDPTVPVISVASNEAFSIAAWTRIDPAGVDSINGLWSSERRASGAWDPPHVASPASVGALLLGVESDGTARAVWTARDALALATATWSGSGTGAPKILAPSAAGAHIELSASPGSRLGISSSGESVVVYALVAPTGMTLMSARSADGVSWMTETIADLAAGSSWHSVTNAAGQVLLTWGSPPDQAMHATLYSTATGWSQIAAPNGVRNDEAAIALADDGRVAIADSELASVPVGCTPRASVRVHRLVPGAGWSEPDIVDDAGPISSVTALGYAGPELLVLWQREPREATYAVALPGP
jgi:hypothetical protein